MSVNVAAGEAYVPGSESGGQGVYFCINDATKNLAISTAPGTGQSRIDLVVARVQDSFYSGASDVWALAVIAGTPSASPSAPAAPANSITLAQVLVGANVTSITSGNITDKRYYAGIGGVILCTTTTRPNSALVPKGQIIFEDDTDTLRFWTGAAWQLLQNSTGRATVVGSRLYTGSNVTSTGSEVALGAWTSGDSPTTLENGRLYKFELTFGFWNSGTVNAFVDNQIAIRRDVNDTTSPLLMQYRIAAGGGSSPIVWHTAVSWAKNISGGNVSATLGVTVAKMTGANAVLNQPVQLTVYDIAAVSDYPAGRVAGLNPWLIT